MPLRIDPDGSADGRYHRQGLISWWDQDRVARARVLVVGAGALGNEILKTLALLGVGRTLVCDMDRIERSNLSRSVLFRTEDEGLDKAAVAARRMREMNPEVSVRALVANVVHEVGLGVFRWADVVISGVDNREARIFVNAACSRTRRTWVDGAIEGLAGTVRGFRPHEGVCYECTMNETDRRQVAERRSCALLARDLVSRGHVPQTATTAAIVGAWQVQEALKLLHDQPALVGEGLHLDGHWGEVSRVGYPRRPDCYGHPTPEEIHAIGVRARDASVGDLLDRAEAECGEGAVLELSRDVVVGLTCPDCQETEDVGIALGAVREGDAACPRCEAHRIVEIAGVVSRGGKVNPGRTLAEIGIPPYDVVVARRGIEDRRAWLLDGDEREVLGDLVAAGGGET